MVPATYKIYTKSLLHNFMPIRTLFLLPDYTDLILESFCDHFTDLGASISHEYPGAILSWTDSESIVQL